PRPLPVQRLPAAGRAGRHPAAGRHHRRHRHRRPPPRQPAARRRRAPGEVTMSPIPIHHYLIVGAVLFVLGLVGFLARRNLISIVRSVELVPQARKSTLRSFARYRGNLQVQAFTLFTLTVAACEAAIALALILMLFRRRHSLDVSLWQELREPDQPPTLDEEP